MKYLILILLITSCSKEQLTHDFGISVAYPPYSCIGLEPDHVEISIDGKMYTLQVQEVKGGFITPKSLSLEYGTYTIDSMTAYDKNGNQTHYTKTKLGGMVGMVLPAQLRVSERLPWISNQMFCR